MKENELNKIKRSPYVYSNIRLSGLNSEKPKMEIGLSPQWLKTKKLEVQSIIHSLKEFHQQLINIDAYLDQNIQSIQEDIEKISEDANKTNILIKSKHKEINTIGENIVTCEKKITGTQLEIDKHNTDINNMTKSIKKKKKDPWGKFIKDTFNYDMYNKNINSLRATIDIKTAANNQFNQELKENQNKLINLLSENRKLNDAVGDLSKKLVDLETRKNEVVVIHTNVVKLNGKINTLITDCSSMETFKNLLIPETAEEVKKDIISKFSGQNITLDFPISERPFFDNPVTRVIEVTSADPTSLEGLSFEQRFTTMS